MADESTSQLPHVRTTRKKPYSSSSATYEPPHRQNLIKVANPSKNPLKTRGRNTKTSYKGDDDVDKEADVSHIIGTCPFMCPVQERLQRERLRDLHVFERLNGDRAKSSPTLAVKKFCRTISTKEAKTFDVRPVLVLQETLDYLFGLWYSREQPFEVVHDFIFDRTRSVRQDLTMQNIINSESILMYERMVKFHVLSHHQLRKSRSANISSSLHLNMEQLTKSLMTLFNLYEANQSSQSIHENEAEFYSLYVLLHINPAEQGNSLSLWFRRIPSTILKSKEMCFARNSLRYSRLGNYRRFLCTIDAEASYLQYCVIEPFIDEVRALAVCYLNTGGYNLQPLPLGDISKVLFLQDSDVEPFCNECGLHASDDAGIRCLPTKQTGFSHPDKGFQKYYPLDSERLRRIVCCCVKTDFLVPSALELFSFMLLEPWDVSTTSNKSS